MRSKAGRPDGPHGAFSGLDNRFCRTSQPGVYLCIRATITEKSKTPGGSPGALLLDRDMISKSARSRDLQFNHVGSLRTAISLRNFEFDFLTFFQSFEAIALDCREVDEYVVAVFNGDKAVSFFCVKPFNCSSQMKNLLKSRRKSANMMIITEITHFCKIFKPFSSPS